MKAYVLSDDLDTVSGMRLVGVRGEAVALEADLRQVVQRVGQAGEYGVLMITENLAEKNREYIQNLKMTQNVPLIVEIPSRAGSKRSGDFIANYVREAIGIKI